LQQLLCIHCVAFDALTESKSPDFLPNLDDTHQHVELFQAVEFFEILMMTLKSENLPLKIDEWILLSIAALISLNSGFLRCSCPSTLRN
jgi:hypothetical protein